MEKTGPNAEEAAGRCAKFTDNLRRTVYAPEEILRTAVACLLAGGHLLIEGYPGIGKTVLARSLARSIGADFKRMQFTNDLMPADIQGTSVYDRNSAEFRFKKGPIFANVFLADEINRANPKTQSALLEAMNEGRVSVDAGTFDLPRPFFVLATENPIEFEGTYPLPEAQLDRFLVRLRIGYPVPEDEKTLYAGGSTESLVDNLEPVLDKGEVEALQEKASSVAVEPSLLDYVHCVVSETRGHPDVELGVSPRGALLWLSAAKAFALMEGRSYLVPDDLKAAAVPSLAHRLSVLAARGTADISEAQDAIVRRIVDAVPVPR